MLLGAGALVSAPIMGARADGAKGFVKGLGLGLASAVVLPVVGGAVAATQGPSSAHSWTTKMKS